MSWDMRVRGLRARELVGVVLLHHAGELRAQLLDAVALLLDVEVGLVEQRARGPGWFR